MKFTTPCFVCVEDVDKRDALIDWCASIGYDTNKWKVSPKVRYVFCGAYFAGRCGEKALASLPHNSIDCGENVELFKALAAMNDENDREQWFTNGEDWALSMYNDFDGCMTTAAECEAGNVGCYTYCEECGFRKATAEEIVEYFKTKKK